jgi:small-conductance mechanosensitive channel
MPFDTITDDPVLQRIIAASVFGGFVVVAMLLRAVTSFISHRLGGSRGQIAVKMALGAVRNTGPLFLVTLGIFLGVSALPEAEPWRDGITNVWRVVAALQISHGVASATRVVFGWYGQYVAPRTESQFDDKMFPLLRRFLVVASYLLGALIALDAMGVSISPIIGGLGITGLAVALALQPTLANFFAGTYVLSDGGFTMGDYIELQGGPAGYVIEVGWRSTKIRTWLNNLVVIPNSVMADSIVTNYSGPVKAINIMVTSGVSYESDLQKVEEASLEVGRALIEGSPDAVKSTDAFFGFDSFGDSNIEFWVFLQARDRWGSFVLTNELIKRLHARFKEDGIEINYPVRKLIYGTSLSGLAIDSKSEVQP